MNKLLQILLAILGGISVSVVTFQLLEINIEGITINIGTTPEKSPSVPPQAQSAPKNQNATPAPKIIAPPAQTSSTPKVITPPAQTQNNVKNQTTVSTKITENGQERTTSTTQVDCTGKSDYVCKRMAEVLAARKAAESKSNTVENQTIVSQENNRSNMTETTEMRSKAILTDSTVVEGKDENTGEYRYEMETTVKPAQ